MLLTGNSQTIDGATSPKCLSRVIDEFLVCCILLICGTILPVNACVVGFEEAVPASDVWVVLL